MIDFAWLLCLGAYLIGSIPSSVWIGKVFYKIDIRHYGSGNAGATNTLRVLGKKPAIVVLAIDFLKGILAVSLPYILHQTTGQLFIFKFVNMQLVLGLTAALGHIFPVFAGFKGGKGIATLFAAVLAVNYLVALCCFLVFVVIFLSTKIVSAGNLVVALLFPFFYIIIIHPYRFADNILVGFYTILVLFTHRANIKRILKNQEPAFQFKKKN